jgi:hypothetical protein
MPDLLARTIKNPRISGTLTADGAITWSDSTDITQGHQFTKTAVGGTAETLQTWRVSDDGQSFLRLANSSASNGTFAPMFWAAYAQSSGFAGLYFSAGGVDTTSSTPNMVFESYDLGGGTIENRPLMEVRNSSTGIMGVSPTGLYTRNSNNAQTSNYTLLDTDHTIRVDASGGAFTLTLPAASGRAGKVYTIIRTDVAFSTNALTIDANASELINSNLTYTLWTGESITIECTGTAWECIHQPEPAYPAYNFLRGATLNRRYIAGLDGANAVLLTATTGPTVNTLYAMPFFVSRTTKFDTIEYELTTQGAGSQVRLGVYFDNGNGYPGKLLFGSADVTGTNPAGAKVATITAASQVFNPGLYWLAYENSATVPLIRCLPATECMSIGGYASPFSTTPPGLCWTVAHTVGTLPDPYTAGGTLRTAVSAAGSPIPAVGLRAV